MFGYEAQIVGLIFAWRSSGDSFAAIARRLNENQIASPSGKERTYIAVTAIYGRDHYRGTRNGFPGLKEAIGTSVPEALPTYVKRRRNSPTSYALKWLVACAGCGLAMESTRYKPQRRRRGASGVRHYSLPRSCR